MLLETFSVYSHLSAAAHYKVVLRNGYRVVQLPEVWVLKGKIMVLAQPGDVTKELRKERRLKQILLPGEFLFYFLSLQTRAAACHHRVGCSLLTVQFEVVYAPVSETKQLISR